MSEEFKPENREVLLLTGLGDDETVGRQLRFINWLNNRRSKDAQIRVFPTKWQTQESYDAKWNRLLAYISSYSNIKVVYGISAGASLGLSLVPELPIETEYHFISGKLLNPGSIGTERNIRAPALYESVVASEGVIATTNLEDFDIHCHSGYLDGVLEQKDMCIPGLPLERIPMINHSATIALAYLTILRRL